MSTSGHRFEGGGGRLVEDEAAELVRHVGGLSQASLPLPSGLRALGAELGGGRLGGALESLAESLEAGQSVEEALASSNEILPPHLAALIVSGSRSGRLGERLVEFLAYYRAGDAIRRRLWLALFYPALLVVLAIGAFTVLSSLLAGGLYDTFEDFGVRAFPAVTLGVLALARPFAAAGVWVLLGPLALGLLGWGFLWFMYRPAERRRLWLAVPLIGPVYRLTALAEFCQALAVLVESEIPMPEALGLAARAARDASLEQPCAEAGADLADGLPLGEAMAARGVFPEGLPRFLRWAEGGSTLPEGLRLAAGIFEARARAQAEYAATFLATLAIASVLWWVAVVMFGLIWPMVTLITILGF